MANETTMTTLTLPGSLTIDPGDWCISLAVGHAYLRLWDEQVEQLQRRLSVSLDAIDADAPSTPAIRCDGAMLIVMRHHDRVLLVVADCGAVGGVAMLHRDEARELLGWIEAWLARPSDGVMV